MDAEPFPALSLPYEPVAGDRPCPTNAPRNLGGIRLGRRLTVLALSWLLLASSSPVNDAPVMSVAQILDSVVRILPRPETIGRNRLAAQAPTTPAICSDTGAGGLRCSDRRGDYSPTGSPSGVDAPNSGGPSGVAETTEGGNTAAAPPQIAEKNIGQEPSAELESEPAERITLADEICEGLDPPRLGCPHSSTIEARSVNVVSVEPAESPIVTQRLEGVWHSSNYILRVDAGRLQANVNGNAPFSWQRFRVRQASSNEVVFAVGAQIFVAKVAESSLRLTSTSFRGEKELTRLALSD